MDLSKRLLWWRTRCDLTLREVSKLSRVHMSTYSMAERGERDLHTARLAAVVERAFRVSLPKFWAARVTEARVA